MAETVDFQRQPMRKTGIFFACASRWHCSDEQLRILETSFNPMVGSNPSLPPSDLIPARGSDTNEDCGIWLVDILYSLKFLSRSRTPRSLLLPLVAPLLFSVNIAETRASHCESLSPRLI